MRSHAILVAVLAASLPCATQTVGAQQMIRGIVLEAESHKPIAEAQLALLTENGRDTKVVARTDSLGVFTLSVALAGRYRLRAQRIGYLVTTTPVVTISAGTLNSYELLMSATAQPIAPLVITERPTLISPKLQAFEYRRATLNGTFFTQKQIEERSPEKISHLLREVAGVRINEQEGRDKGVYSIRVGCPMDLWVDGVRLLGVPEVAFEFMNLQHPLQIYGIEIYQGASQVPAEFSGVGAGCGAVVIWTKRGR